jgi:HEAT repeat protein
VKPLVLISVLVAHAAVAAGALPVTLPAKELTALNQHLATDRAAHPEAWRRVAALRASLAQVDRSKRGPHAPITSWLNAIPDATWALADALVYSGAADPGLPESAHLAWQAGLLESLGSRRDPKTEAILRAALVAPGLAPAVRRSAADGLGRLGTEGAATALIDAATTLTGAQRTAVIEGMGSCRRLTVTAFLTRTLGQATAEPEQLALIKALSVNGNEWALQTTAGAPVPADTERIRSLAASALVRAFVSLDGHLKTEARDALRIVNAPDTAVLLAQSRAADPAGVDGLIQTLRR